MKKQVFLFRFQLKIDGLRKKRKVFVCPLDWGLGHATRCIPVISEFLRQDCEVYLGGSGKSMLILKEEFPELKLINVPGYKIQYAVKPFFFLFLIIQAPLFLFSVLREYFLLRKIQKREKFDIIISDNRYGLYSPQCKSIFITHQVHIILPGGLKIFQNAAHCIIHNAINKFDECWIPDFPGDKNLSGKLSHNIKNASNFRYVGTLSRFSETSLTEKQPVRYEIVAIVSGPEPHRSSFEKILENQLKIFKGKSLLIRGIPGEMNFEKQGRFSKVNHLPAAKFAAVIQSATYVICRSGYSSVMDMLTLNRKALLVPTPGQTEQEYIAGYLNEIGLFPNMEQKSFNLNAALSILDNYSFDFSAYQSPGLLRDEIERITR